MSELSEFKLAVRDEFERVYQAQRVAEAQSFVHASAIHALVSTHPAPKAFAAAFAAEWLRSGEQHSSEREDAAVTQALDVQLEFLENALAARGVQWSVRAPRP